MKQLDKIRKSKDTYLTKYVFKQMEMIKTILNIPKNSRIYFLYYSRGLDCFLFKNKIIISNWSCERDEHKNHIVDSMKVTDLYVITLLKEYPKTNEDIIFETIKQGEKQYTIDNFLNWIDMPSIINGEIDLPYYKIIKFLQGYNKTTFKTDNYLFYSKKDDEYCYTLNIYAKDLRNNAELKLYIPDKNIETDCGEWITIPPQNMRDVFAVDLSGKLSKYQIRQCKKEFLKCANEYCNDLGTKNFYGLELVKQTIQPVWYESGWAVARVFSNDDKSLNIWVGDFMLKDEKPYFMITNPFFSWETTKIAVIDMNAPTYHKMRIKKIGNQKIYKQGIEGIVKFKNWELDEEYIKKLMDFLKSPSNEVEKMQYNKEFAEIYSKYVKTNWQHLIFEYNHNTFDWAWDGNYDVPPDKTKGQIPFDLPIPDYTKLLQDEDKE